MFKLARLISVVAVAAGLFFATPVAAEAGPAATVSKAEFRHVSKGMTITRVHRLFDTGGKQTAYYDGYKCGTRFGWCPEQDREYRVRSRWVTSTSATRSVPVRGGFPPSTPTGAERLTAPPSKKPGHPRGWASSRCGHGTGTWLEVRC